MLAKKLQAQLADYISNHYLKIFKNKNCKNKLQKNFSIEFLAQGEYNINYIIKNEYEKKVLRINTASQLNLKNQIKYEYDALIFLKQSEVTPIPFYLDDSKKEIPYGLLTMEFLQGKPLNYKTDLERAANIFGKIHNLQIPKAHSFIIEDKLFSSRIKEANWLMYKVWNSECVTTETKQFFKKFLKWAEDHKKEEKYFLEHRNLVLNNTEVNSFNFILGKKDYLIDWEKPVISDSTQDITQFLIPTTTLWKSEIVLQKSELNNFYKAYSKHTNCTEDGIKLRVHLYTPYMFLRALSWCASAFVEYSNHKKQIVNNDAIIKIKEYLKIENLTNWLSPYFNF